MSDLKQFLELTPVLKKIICQILHFFKLAKIYTQNRKWSVWGQGMGNKCNTFPHMETLVVSCKFQNLKS